MFCGPCVYDCCTTLVKRDHGPTAFIYLHSTIKRAFKGPHVFLEFITDSSSLFDRAPRSLRVRQHHQQLHRKAKYWGSTPDISLGTRFQSTNRSHDESRTIVRRFFLHFWAYKGQHWRVISGVALGTFRRASLGWHRRS